jgi:hypothetical protein
MMVGEGVRHAHGEYDYAEAEAVDGFVVGLIESTLHDLGGKILWCTNNSLQQTSVNIRSMERLNVLA